MNIYRYWFKYALFFLFIIALIGLFLRFQFLSPTLITFNNFLHGHSHVAMLGWLFTVYFIFYIYYFLPEHKNDKTLKILFYLFQAASAGMMIAFPIQGYKAFSIALSTLHLLLSYYFIFYFLKNTKNTGSLSFKFTKYSLIMLAISSLGPWALALYLAQGGKSGDVFYSMAIYFYLHFLYNGFFTFGILGVILKLLEHRNINFDDKNIRIAFNLLVIMMLPAYTHSLLGFNFPIFVLMLAVLSTLLELYAVRILFREFYSKRLILFEGLSKPGIYLLQIGILCFLLKYLMQLISILPGIEQFAFHNREMILGYLHLSLLGFLSLTALGISEKIGLITFRNQINKYGIYLLISGFIISELLLFLPGINIFINFGTLSDYHLLLFIFSFIMFIGITLIFINDLQDKENLDVTER